MSKAYEKPTLTRVPEVFIGIKDDCMIADYRNGSESYHGEIPLQGPNGPRSIIEIYDSVVAGLINANVQGAIVVKRQPGMEKAPRHLELTLALAEKGITVFID
jgi:hypothetical protein